MFVDFDFFLLDLAKTATHNNFQKMKKCLVHLLGPLHSNISFNSVCVN